MSIFRKKDKEKEPELTFASQPHLKLLKPKERYIFHSDYFMVDNYYATILSYAHHAGAGDKFGDFWGINLLEVPSFPREELRDDLVLILQKGCYEALKEKFPRA